MAESDKSIIRSTWAQFFAAQAVVLLFYSLGLAYWLGGFSNKVAHIEKATIAQEARIEAINNVGTQPGRLDNALNVSQERRIQILETNVNQVNYQLGVIVNEVGSINKKLDNLDKK